MGRSDDFSPFDMQLMKDDAEMMIDDGALLIDGQGSAVKYQYRFWKRRCNTAG